MGIFRIIFELIFFVLLIPCVLSPLFFIVSRSFVLLGQIKSAFARIIWVVYHLNLKCVFFLHVDHLLLTSFSLLFAAPLFLLLAPLGVQMRLRLVFHALVWLVELSFERLESRVFCYAFRFFETGLTFVLYSFDPFVQTPHAFKRLQSVGFLVEISAHHNAGHFLGLKLFLFLRELLYGIVFLLLKGLIFFVRRTVEEIKRSLFLLLAGKSLRLVQLFFLQLFDAFDSSLVTLLSCQLNGLLDFLLFGEILADRLYDLQSY